MADLMDDEGENQAVRTFLKFYGSPGLTVGGMALNMSMCGFPLWPEWVGKEPASAHLTKAGAQLWLRYLFALESTPPMPSIAPAPQSIEREATNWQPLKTAPKDGAEFLVRYPLQGNVKQLVRWNRLRGYWVSKGEPQLGIEHQQAEWHPLPPDESAVAPQSEQTKGGNSDE